MSNLTWFLLAALLFAIGIGPSNSYVAVPRAGTVAVVVGTKVYIQGGYTTVQGRNGGPPTNDMLILPIDQSFNLSNPPWDPASGTFPGPAIQGQIAGCGGYNNTIIYFFGGQYEMGTFNNDTNMLWTFDTTNNTWGQPTNYIGAPPPAVDSHSGVSRYADNSIWVFGGEENQGRGARLFSSTYKLATYPTLTWNLVGGNAPGGGRQAHTANLLSDGRMVILGGKCQSDLCPFSEVLVFNTNSSLWSVLNASLAGDAPLPRISHISVTTNDDKIIIHGGEPIETSDLAVLDMKAVNLTWSMPVTTGLAPSPRFAHSAVMVGTIAFIMFGQINNTVDNKIYALDTDKWTWLQTYNPSHLEYTNTGNVPSNSTPSLSPTTLTTGSPTEELPIELPYMAIAMYIAVSICVIGISAAAIAGVLICKRRRADPKGPTPPNLVGPNVLRPYDPYNNLNHMQPLLGGVNIQKPYDPNNNPGPMKPYLVNPNLEKPNDPNDNPSSMQPYLADPNAQKPNDPSDHPSPMQPNLVDRNVRKPYEPSYCRHAPPVGNVAQLPTFATAALLILPDYWEEKEKTEATDQ